MKILVLGPNKPFLGAQIVQLPFLSGLRARWEEARITLALPFSGPTLFEEIRFHDVLDQGWAGSPARTLRLMLRSAVSGIDAVYSLRARSTRTGLVALASGARRRFGFETAGGRLFYRPSVPPRERVYLALKYLDLLGGGPAEAPPPVSLWSPEIAFEITAQFVERGISTPCLGILLGAGGEPKRWPTGRFLAVARQVRAEFPAVTVLYFLSPGEAGGAIGRALDGVERRFVFALRDLRALACALSRCAALLSTDCGPAHFGHLLGMPQCVLFDGRGRPHEWFLPRPGARMLQAPASSDVSGIGVPEVVESLREILAGAVP